MALQHSFKLKQVLVEGKRVTAVYDNTLNIDGEKHADFQHQAFFNLTPPTYTIRGGNELIMGGSYPAGSHFHLTIGDSEINFDAVEETPHYALVQILVNALPDTITPFINSEPLPDQEDFVSVLYFEDSGFAGTRLALSEAVASGTAVQALPADVADFLRAVVV